MNTILGGFIGGGTTSSALKRHIQVLKSVHLVEKRIRSMPSFTFIDKAYKALDSD